MPHSSVILVSQELATVNAVTTALQSNGQLRPENVCRDMNELGNRLAASPIPAVLVDIDSQTAHVLGALDSLVRRFPETRFVVLARVMDPRLLLDSMQAGARHFITKTDVPASLCDVLRRLNRAATPASGGVVSVLSASGGCGATTIAVNLACELRSATPSPVMLVDLDCIYGGVGAYLGLEATYGSADLLERTGSIDPELVSTSALANGDNLKVLLSGSPSRLGMPGGFARLRDAVQACAHSASMVVIDAPRLSPDTTAELAGLSTTTLLVMQLNVKDVRAARSMLASLRARGISSDTVIPVVNRYRRRSAGLDLDEARRALDGAELLCLSNDFQAASESINFGQPLEKTAPRSPFRKDLQQLAARLRALATPVPGVVK